MRFDPTPFCTDNFTQRGKVNPLARSETRRGIFVERDTRPSDHIDYRYLDAAINTKARHRTNRMIRIAQSPHSRASLPSEQLGKLRWKRAATAVFKRIEVEERVVPGKERPREADVRRFFENRRVRRHRWNEISGKPDKATDAIKSAASVDRKFNGSYSRLAFGSETFCDGGAFVYGRVCVYDSTPST